jgi:hypothetical protein
MFFWSLLLAHVVADFPFQTDAIFRLKTKYSWGVLPHVVICTLMNILALYPYLSTVTVWSAIVVLGLIHTILDRTKISVSEKISRDNFFQFFIDQVLHVLSIWMVALWLSKSIDQNAYHVSGFLANRELIIQLTAYIFAAFAGVPIIFYALKFWFSEISAKKMTIGYPTFIQRVPGNFERFLATLGVVWGGWWLVLLIGAFLPRILLKWKDEDRALINVSAVVGIIVSLLCGLVVRVFS